MKTSPGVLGLVALVFGFAACALPPLATPGRTSAITPVVQVPEAQPPSSGHPFGLYDVMVFGAAGDGQRDDTAAFQAAIDAAAAQGGTVIIPPVPPGRGYVLQGTVTLPPGVGLIGAPAGFASNGWAAYSWPERHVRGAKIFARPSQVGAPLFRLEGGNTVRGLWIIYDEQPMPSDEELQDPESPYYYPTFEQARESFIPDHVRLFGPTFYVAFGDNVVLEDIIADRYVDFFYLKAGGKVSVNRVLLYGYRSGFVIEQSFDVNRLSHIHFGPNVGPISPGTATYGGVTQTHTWIYGIIASQPENVGVHMGVADGYRLEDLFFVNMNTAIRLGASDEYPISDPVAGTVWTNRTAGFEWTVNGAGTGPWGQMSDIEIDQCGRGLHFIWPNHQGNQVSNLIVFPSIDDGSDFPASAGTGPLGAVANHAAFVFEPTFNRANNNVGVVLTPVVLASNVSVSSFRAPAFVGPAASDVIGANGRVFLIGGDVSLEVNGLSVNPPYTRQYLFASGPQAGEVSIRVRGFLLDGRPQDDLWIRATGVTDLP